MSRPVRLPDGTVVTDCFSGPQIATPSAATSEGNERLALGQSRVPDVLECLANLSSDEVFTPPRIANEMLDLLPAEVWTDPTLRWLDPGCKSGVFLREAARRLMVGLTTAIPDEDARRRHIFTEMLHGYAITELTAMTSRRSLYYTKDATSEERSVVIMHTPEGNIRFDRGHHNFSGDSCSVCGAGESLERGEERENYAYTFIHRRADAEDMKFDVVIGNPPYHLDGGNGARPTQIYHLFVESALRMKPRYVSMIIPSRWAAMGRELASFRSTMLEGGRLREFVSYPNSAECFPDVDIKGGVCYFLWDSNHAGKPCGVVEVAGGKASQRVERALDEFAIFVRSNESAEILRKVFSKKEATLDEVVQSRVPFGIDTNFKNFKAKKAPNLVKLYVKGAGDGKPDIGWIHRAQVTARVNLVDKHKVLTPKAADGSGSYPIQVLSPAFLGEPGSACSDTYLVVGAYDTKAEAENLQSFLATRFCRFLVSLRKITQDLNKGGFAFVPKLDMTVRWTDQMLYQRYGLTQDEIDFIESRIREMT